MLLLDPCTQSEARLLGLETACVHGRYPMLTDRNTTALVGGVWWWCGVFRNLAAVLNTRAFLLRSR